MNALEALTKAVKKAGTQTAFAQQNGLSIAYVNDVMRGRKEPGDKILKALGLKRVTSYERNNPDV